MAWDIVIAGGGFGGFYAARTLEKTLPPHSARVTLVSDVNFMLFTPLLPGAAAGTLEPRHVVVPLREQLTTTDLRLGRVSGAAPERNQLIVDSLDGRRRRAALRPADRRARARSSRTLPIPGLAEHAIGFKTLSEAIALRNRVLSLLEIAETVDRRRARAELPHVRVRRRRLRRAWRGSPSCRTSSADVIDLYPRCRVQGMRWILVEAKERVMPEIPPKLAALRRARAARPRDRDPHEHDGRGGHRALRVRSRRAARSSRRARVAWTAGVKPQPGRRETRPAARPRAAGSTSTARCACAATTNVWAIGDAAAVPDPARKGAAVAADRAARDPPGAPRRAQRRRRARRRRAREAVHVQDEGRVRRHGPPPGGRQHDGDHAGAASPPGSSRGPTTSRTCRARSASCACSSTGPSRCCSAATRSELGQLGHPPELDDPQTPPAAPRPDRAADGRASRRRSAALPGCRFASILDRAMTSLDQLKQRSRPPP